MMKSAETRARLLLCVSESGTNFAVVNHTMRRLEFNLAEEEDLDFAVAGCGREVIRPFAVFFAPTNEINCAKCIELLK
jgi:hypothetical protein